MPTVLRWGPYRAFFYSNESGEPPHVHVGRVTPKPSSGFKTCRSRSMRDFPAREIGAIIRHLRSHRDALEGKWHEHFGN
jgi:hypothetical protein